MPSDGDTRAALRRVARTTIRKKGYAASSLRAVAAEAGLTTGAVYSQYADKAALLADAVDSLPALPRVGSRTGPGDTGMVLALAAEALIRPGLRSHLRSLLLRHEASLADSASPDAARLLLAAAVGDLVLRAAGLAMPEDWEGRLRS